MKHIGIYLFRFTSWVFSRIPLPVLYIFADIVYFILNHVIRYRKKVVIKNLRNSFPEKSESEIKKITNRFYHHLGDIFVENIALIRMAPEKAKKMIEFESCVKTAHELFNQNKHIILVTAHYNNWEYFLVLPLLSPHKTLGIYKPLNNKYYDKEFFNMRTKFGAIPVSMNDSLRKIIEYDKNKQYVTLGLIADQRPPRASSNYWTNFLNQESSIFLGPEKIARKFNAPIIFTYLEKVKRGKYKMIFDRIIDNPKQFKEFEITEAYIRWIEKIIQEKPEYYLWSHNRWKHKRNPVK